MERQVLKTLAEEIANRLALEIAEPLPPTSSGSAALSELLLDQVADRVVALLDERARAGVESEEIESRLMKAERQLEKMSASPEDDDDDDDDRVDGEVAALPNLKYAKPKYRNLDTMMEYIEGPEGQGGVKLVIMNFND